MEPKDYVIIKIEGEYATLRDDDSKEELFIAMVQKINHKRNWSLKTALN